MENNSTPNISSGNQSSRLHIVLPVLALVAGCFIGYFAAKIGNAQIPSLQDSKVNTPRQTTNSPEGWSLIPSSKKGVGVASKFTDTNGRLNFTVSIYSIEDSSLRDTELTVNDDHEHIENSTDHLFTAVLNSKDSNLWLLSNETLKSQQVTNHGKVSSVIDWSPDGKKILYTVGTDTIETRTQGFGEPDYTKMNNEAFDPNLKNGVHVFNIQTGEDTWIYPVENAVGFITDSMILSFVESEKLVIFNLDNFSADYSKAGEKFGFGAGQFSIANDGKKWTYTLSRNPTNDANIVLADFPNKEGIDIAQGRWAEIQWPKISPSSLRVAFMRNNGIQLYDVNSKDTKSFTDPVSLQSRPLEWVDEDILVIRNFDASKKTASTYLLNVETRETTLIY